MKDEEIVNLYWKRDEKAIQETTMKYGAYLSKIAYNILSDSEDSDECVNDTYLAAWNSMPENRPCMLSTYLGRITRQISIDRFRKRNSKKRFASEYAVSLSEMEDCFENRSTTEQEVESGLLDEAINSFVRALPDAARKVFIGRYYFFDSVKEMASYCSMSESSVKTMLYRIRQKLKDYLVKEGFEV